MNDHEARKTGTPNPNDAPYEDGLADPAGGVEAEGGRTRQRWSRRAVAGGLLLGAGGLFGGGLTFSLWPRRTPTAPEGGKVVPLRSPETAETAAGPERPPEHTAAAEAADVPATAARPEGRPLIAVVIDDLGLRQEETRRATRLPGALTLAFLPYGQSLAAHTSQALANGHEVIVHVPMDPGSRADPGPKALRLGQGAAEMEQRLAWNLAQVPRAVGVNNHMGSALTENAAAMETVLTALKREGRYFLDSRTTANSAARGIAHRLNLPYAERDVFLDNDTSPEAIARQLAETENVARRYGSAIAIGHPHRQTLHALEGWVEAAQAKGFEIVPVSTIIAARGSALWRLTRDRKGGVGS